MNHPDKLDDMGMSHQMAMAAAAVANGPSNTLKTGHLWPMS